MSDATKPREFWVLDNNDGCLREVLDFDPKDGAIHCIEKSAYAALKAQLDEANKKLAALRESSVPKEKVDRLVEALKKIANNVHSDDFSVVLASEYMAEEALAEFEGKGEL